MIDKILNINSKTELMPYGIYGNASRNQNQNKNNNENKKNEDVDTFNKDDKKTNPFEDIKNQKNSKIQEYFNQRYAKINADIKDVICRISKNSKYTHIIDTAIIDSQALLMRYLYNNTLPQVSDKKFELSKEGNRCTIEVFDINDILLLKFDFVNGFIVKIITFFENGHFEIYIKKENILNRILGNFKTQVEKYQRKDKNNSLLEEVVYSKDGQIERYISYSDTKKQSEILFDTSIVHFRPEIKDKLIPLKYSLYDTQNEYMLENLVYTFSMPNKYQQYNSTTGKIVKSFILQGLRTKVVKYAFFNSINGQMTACGSL